MKGFFFVWSLLIAAVMMGRTLFSVNGSLDNHLLLIVVCQSYKPQGIIPKPAVIFETSDTFCLGYGKSLLLCFGQNIHIQWASIFPTEVLEPQICWKKLPQCLDISTATSPYSISQKKHIPLFTKHLFSCSEQLHFRCLAAEKGEVMCIEESEGWRTHQGLILLEASGVLKGMVWGLEGYGQDSNENMISESREKRKKRNFVQLRWKSRNIKIDGECGFLGVKRTVSLAYRCCEVWDFDLLHSFLELLIMGRPKWQNAAWMLSLQDTAVICMLLLLCITN